jgi:hypothetical protein
MKSIAKHFIGFAMLTFLLQINYLNAQNDVLQYAICQNCIGNNPTMGQAVNYTIDQISSDYGMRVVSGGTRYHLGIDYVPPPNAAVLAVRGGTITDIVGSGLKKIVVQHNDNTYYSYLHIFRDNIPESDSTIREGAFVLYNVRSGGCK